MHTQIRIKISEINNRSFDLKLRNNPAYETTVMQPHSSINNPVELTVDINPAYEVNKSKPQQQLQDESEPSYYYEVIPTVSGQQNKDKQKINRGQPKACS